MAENDFIASVGFIPDSSSLERIAAAVGTAVEKGAQAGSKRGLIQGINSNNYTQPLGRISGKANEFEKSMAAANARVIAFGASVAPIFAMRAAFDKLVESTIEVEKMMTDINAIFGLSKASLRSFTTELVGVSNATSQSFTMATEAATEFARQGLNVEETLKRTSAALILNKISGLSMGEAVSSITSILNGFAKEALSATEIINRMTAVDTQFAVSAGDLAEALKRVGASANDANVSFNETLALITAARQITGREGSVIGNSFKTMFTRLQRPEVLDQLEEAGIKVRDLNGKILPTITAFSNLAHAYDGLAQSQKSSISEMVGGVYQINILKGVMRDANSQVSIFDGALRATENSTTAITKRMETLNSTLSAGLIRTMNDLALASSNVGQALLGSSMRSGIEGFDNILKSTASNANPDNKSVSAQTVQAGLKGLGNFLAGPGLQLGVTIILKLLARLQEFAMESGKDLLGLDAGGKERENLEKRMVEILSQEKEKIDEIISGKRTLNSLVKETVQASIQQNQSDNLVKELSSAAAKQILASPKGGQKASGYIPNLDIVKSETDMARQGGYVAGRVISTRIQNGNQLIGAIANTNETKSVITKGGKMYEYINPPYGSRAGKSHEQESIRKNGINPYSLPQMPLTAKGFIPMDSRKFGDKINNGKGFVPNLAKLLGEGSYARFYDLEKERDSLPLGVKIFSGKRDRAKKEALSEYNMGVHLSSIGGLNSLFHIPSTLDTKGRLVYKEVVEGKNLEQMVFDKLGSDKIRDAHYEKASSLNAVLEPFQRLFYNEMGKKGVTASDVIGHHGNTILNSKAQNIFHKMSNMGYPQQEKFFNHLDKHPNVFSQMSSAIARQGGRLSFPDVGEFRARNVRNFAGGNIPRITLGISHDELRDILQSKQFQSFKYQKSNGDVGEYHSSQWRVRRDKLVGANAPAGHKSWTDFDESTNTIALHVKKAGVDEEGRFRRFSLTGFRTINTNGKTFALPRRLMANGEIPDIESPDYAEYIKWDSILKEQTQAKQYGSPAFLEAWQKIEHLKNKPVGNASGHIPNLYSPIADALNRENIATGGFATLSSDSRLVTRENPYGLAAIDSRNQKSASHAITQHMAGGQSLQQVKKAHTATGFVPNLAGGLELSALLSTVGFASNIGNSTEKIQKFINLFPALFSETEKEIFAKRKLVDSYDKMSRDLITTGKTQDFYGNKFSNGKELSKSPVTTNIERLRSEVSEFATQKDSDRQNTWRLGLKTSTYSSFIGGIASQGLSNYSPSASAAADEISTGTTAAAQALMAFPNKIGVAIGVGLATTGIIKSFDVFKKGIETSRVATDLEITRIKTVNENLLSLSQTSSNLNNLYIDSTSSVETISRESKKFSETLATLSELPGGKSSASRILAAPDSQSRQGVIQEMNAENAKKMETLASLQSAKELFGKKSFLGMNHLPGFQQDAGYTYSNPFEKDTVQQQLVENAQVPIANMSDEFKKALQDSVTNLDAFNNILATFQGEDASGVRDYLDSIKKSGGPVASNQVLQEIRSILSNERLLKNPEMGAVVARTRGTLFNRQLDIDSSVKQEQYIKRLFLNQGAIRTGNIIDVNAIQARGTYNASLGRFAGYDANSSLYEQTHGERSVARRTFAIDNQRNAVETGNSLKTMNNEIQKTLTNALSSDFDKIIKTEDLASNITGEKNLGISDYRTNLISSINAGLSSVMKSSGGDILGKFSGKGGQFDFQAFAKEVATGGSSDKNVQGKIEKYINSQQSVEMLKTLNQSNVKQIEILQDFKLKSVEATQKLEAAIKEADFKRQVNYLGGIQSLLNRDTLRSTMRDLQRGMSMMNNVHNSTQSKAMGAGLVLESYKKFGVEMDDSKNESVKQAHQAFVQNGAETFRKLGGRLLANVGRGVGSGDSYTGLSKILGGNLNEIVEKQYQAEFKPEGKGGTESGLLGNQDAYLRPFDDGLAKATNSLIEFPDAVAATAQTLQSIAMSIQEARDSYAQASKETDKILKATSDSIQNRFSESSKGPQVPQQKDYLWGMREVLPTAGSLIGTAFIIAASNGLSKLGSKAFSSIITNITRNINKPSEEIIPNAARGPVSDFEQQSASFSETMKGIRSDIGSFTNVGRKGSGYGTGIGGGSRFTDNSNLIESSNQIRIPSSGSSLPKVSTILEDLGQPKTSFSVNRMPRIINQAPISTPFRMNGQFADVDQYIQGLKNAYYNKLVKLATNSHGEVNDRILTRILDNGKTLESYIDPIEKLIRRQESSRISGINFRHNMTVRNHMSLRDESVSASMAEKARVPANILRQDSLKASIERAHYNAWFERIAANNAKIPMQDAPQDLSQTGESFLPRSLDYASHKGFSADFMKQFWGKTVQSRGISNKLASEQFSGFVRSLKTVGRTAGFLLNPLNLREINSQMGKADTRLFNPFNISAFKNAGFWGKSFRGIGAAGAILSAKDSYEDYKEAYKGKENYSRSGGYAEATGNLANNVLGFAGIPGLAMSATNRLIKHDAVAFGEIGGMDFGPLGSFTNKKYGMASKNADDADYNAMEERLLPRILAQRKRKQQQASILEKNLINKNQAQISEDMGNDTNFAQGRTKLDYHTLQVELDKSKQKDGSYNLGQLSATSLDSLKSIYSKENHGQRATSLQGIAHEVGGDYSINGKYQQDLLSVNSKILPTALNARTYTDANGQITSRTLNTNQAAYNNNLINQVQKTEENGDTKEMIKVLEEMKVLLGEKNQGNTTQQVDFSALPINVNISVTKGEGIDEDVQELVNKFNQTFSNEFSKLKDRMGKIDGQNDPSKVK